MNVQHNKLAAIILAAGSGKRIAELGPKPLLRVNGKTFVEICYTCVEQVGCSPIVIVTNQKLSAELKRFAFKARLVINHKPEQGMISSIWCGMAVLPADVSGFFLVPIDFPLVKLSTFEKMKQTHQQYSDAIIRPQYNHKTGHPVIFSASFFDDLRMASLNEGAKSVVQKHHHLCKDVAVDDSGILININSVDMYNATCKRSTQS